MKKTFYAHDEGAGATIYVIHAASEQDLFTKYPALSIFYPSKAWLKANRQSEFKESDIEENPPHLKACRELPPRANATAAALLFPLDPVLEAFAERRNITLSDVSGAFPRRALTWSDLYFPLRRLHRRRAPILYTIQILLEDPKEVTWSVRARATQYRDDGHYSKQLYLKHAVAIEEIAEELPELLDDAWARVSRWSVKDLQRGP